VGVFHENKRNAAGNSEKVVHPCSSAGGRTYLLTWATLSDTAE